ncbi:MAG: DUF104 domain-containing protein [Chloroflexi bacterium]|nr:DUF104 domain-containing protein [Chloroflexota bacterium]
MAVTYKKTRVVKKAKKVKDLSGTYSVKSSAKIQTIDAVYDGKVFLPNSPLLLKPNTRVRITIETVKVKRAKTKSFLEIASSIKIGLPSDYSENLDDYLYRGKTFNDK